MPKVIKAGRKARVKTRLATPGGVKTSVLSGKYGKYVDASSASAKELAKMFLDKFPAFSIKGAETAEAKKAAMERKIEDRRVAQRKDQENMFIDEHDKTPPLL